MLDSTLQLALAADGSKPIPGGASPKAAALSRTRVYVDQDSSGAFIYRLVEVTTGRVVVELPREQAGGLKDTPGYAA